MKKFWAFTLAETLIVMGVIGIVAALTLPNLNSSTGDKERVAKVKKIYQNLQDAVGRAEAVYGNIDEWFINDNGNDDKINKRYGERITEFMKTSKVCGINRGMGCFNGTEDNAGGYKIITADGTSVNFFYKSGDSTISARVDIDGPNKGSNAGGKELFDLIYKYDPNTKSIIPYCDNLSAKLSSLFADPSGESTCAFAWIINIGNMDYLKANSDGKCKNNASITLDGVTNTTCK